MLGWVKDDGETQVELIPGQIHERAKYITARVKLQHELIDWSPPAQSDDPRWPSHTHEGGERVRRQQTA